MLKTVQHSEDRKHRHLNACELSCVVSTCQQYSGFAVQGDVKAWLVQLNEVSGVNLDEGHVPALVALTDGLEGDYLRVLEANLVDEPVDVREEEVVEVMSHKKLLEHVLVKVGARLEDRLD